MLKKCNGVLLATLLAAATPAWADTETVEADTVTGPTQLTLAELRTFTDIFNLVRLHYVDEIGDKALLDSAMQGLVASLDSHSEILDPNTFRKNDDNSKGRYGGVGIEIEAIAGRMYVMEVIPGTPAYEKGVREGDLILAIDTVAVKGRPIHESFQALHGEPGTVLKLRLQTGNRPSRTLKLKRQYVNVVSVRSELLDDDIGYFHLTHFHSNSAADLEAGIEEIREQLRGKELQGIVLDLRDNLGGVIGAATGVADGFLDDGLMVYTRGRYAAAQLEVFAEPGEWAPGVPVVVLVNNQTASSSEIVAGALQDYNRAILVGQQTYGKGSVQSVLQLRNGNALKLTTARFFTPSGRPIDETGITPDIVVDDADDDGDLVLQRGLKVLREAVQSGDS